MDVDRLLADTFADHEHLAPDEGDVMTAVRERISGRRSGLARSLAIAASVVVVAGAAGVVVILNGDHHSATSPPTQQAAGSTAAVRPAHAPANTATSGITPLTMPFDLGWLPPGKVVYGARRINLSSVGHSGPASFEGQYLLTVQGSHDIEIDVEQMVGGLADAGFKSGAGLATTVNGSRAIESRNSGGPGGYEVYFIDSAGGLMYVTAGPHQNEKVSAAELTAIGRRIASNVRLPGTTKVTPTYGIGYVPTGTTVRAFDIERPLPGLPILNGDDGSTKTSYDIGTGDSMDSAFTVAEGNAAGAPTGAPGRKVQGHPTRYSDDNGYRTVTVLAAARGHNITVSTGRSLEQAYRVADGLVLPD